MKNLNDKQLAVLAVIVGAIINGAGPVFTKIAVKNLTPEYFSFLRFLFSSLVLMPLFLKSGIKLNRDTLKLISISLLASINILLFAHGVKLTTATIGQLLYVLSPVVVFIFSYFLIKEKVFVSKILGVILGILGSFLIIFLPIIQKGGAFSGNFKGNLFLVLGVFLFSIYLVLSKKLSTKFSPVQITTVFSLTTVCVMFVLSFSQITGNPRQFFSLSKETLLAVSYVGIVATAVFYLLQQYAIKHGSPLITSTNQFLAPFSTIIWAYLLLGEKLTSLLIIGGLLVLAGTYFILKPDKKPKAVASN